MKTDANKRRKGLIKVPLQGRIVARYISRLIVLKNKLKTIFAHKSLIETPIGTIVNVFRYVIWTESFGE